MDKLLLKLVALFKRVFTAQGVDYNRMITIVQVKLVMDKRRVYMNWKQKQQKKENSNHLIGVLVFYAFMGALVSLLFFAIPSPTLALIILHSYILFMMAMTLITDFSSVLLDTADNQVILPKPISSKTLFMARMVHILIYLLQFTIALAIIPIGVAFFKLGIVSGLVLIVTVLLTVLLAVFITYILYLLIIRFSSESKVKDIVGYFQIFMTILFAVGFQILPRIIDVSKLADSFELHWYSYFLPPVWMALAIEAISELRFDVLHIAMITAAVIIPLGTFWFMIKYLAPSFAKKLDAMNVGNEKQAVSKTGQVQKQKTALSQTLSNVVCSSHLEKSAFQITWKMTGRDKTFKLQFYPSLAYIAVFIFIFVFQSGRNLESSWRNLASTPNYMWFFYIPMMTVGGSILLVAFNENYLASWIYHSTPVSKPGMLVSGMIKALFIKFFVPVFVLMVGFSLYVWGPDIIDDIVFGLVNNMFCFLIFANLSDHYLPFSRQPNTQQQTGKFIKAMLQLLIIGAIVGVHYLLILSGLSWIMWALVPVVGTAVWLLVKRLQNLRWTQIAI